MLGSRADDLVQGPSLKGESATRRNGNGGAGCKTAYSERKEHVSSGKESFHALVDGRRGQKAVQLGA